MAAAIAGEAIRGSWWAHARSHAIYDLLSAVRDSEDLLVCRLVEGKITLVHRRLWPALIRAADRFPRKALARVRRGPAAAPERPNAQWALDFLEDALASGRKIRVLSVIDVFTREALALEVDTSLPGRAVVRVLDRGGQERALPDLIVLDNGPELISRVLEARTLVERIREQVQNVE